MVEGFWSSPKSITATATALEEFPDEIEADFHRYYHIDLVDFWRGGLSLRKIDVLLRNLPPESAYITAVRDRIDPDEIEHISTNMGPWSKMEMLLAQAIDAINYLYYQQNCIHSGKSSPRPKPPVLVRRPGTESKQELYRKTQRYKDLKKQLEEERNSRR